MTIIGITMYCLAANKPSSFAGDSCAYLYAKFIPLMNFTFTDALYGGFINTVDLVFILSLLQENAFAYFQKLVEFTGNMTNAFSFNITNNPTQNCPEFFHTSSGTFHLPGMSISILHKQQAGSNPVVILPQFTPILFGCLCQSLSSPVIKTTICWKTNSLFLYCRVNIYPL